MKKLYSLLILLTIHFFAAAQEIPKWKIEQLETYIKNANKPIIVNFWATFCKPCIEELPYFQKLANQYKSSGIELLLVSLDLPEAYHKIRPFASKRSITAPIVYLDETNADKFCPRIDESWSGSIPASLFFNPATGYRAFFENELSKEKVEAQIEATIKK
ncbi:redoxin domain-containing protein [Chitinophagaceae bacterium LB-8]|uniref:Redoxin domain-containing protein n=1 Tax=Paraflavisolibacter caeni TaxID=2982496 RepID=A0A9X2XVB4_9BACT|nr:redoxin domain-containing protein [Paraflavisolibacter caeni]MCU7549062.1 redoxin domain-containing protein [Paraflavisolibacter caeni]